MFNSREESENILYFYDRCKPQHKQGNVFTKVFEKKVVTFDRILPITHCNWQCNIKVSIYNTLKC